MADVVANLIARHGYAEQQGLDARTSAWQRVAGSDLSEQTRVGNLKRGVLEIFVGNSVAMQELTFQKRQLLKQLLQELPDQKIVDIRFRFGAID